MPKLIVLSCLFFALQSALHCQENDIGFWRNGSISLKSGKTLEGLVKFGNAGGALSGLQSFRTISFKEDDDSKKEKIKKDDIAFFTISSSNDQKATYTFIPVKKKKTILAKVLVTGKASLFKKVVTPNPNGVNPSNPQTLAPYGLEYVIKEGEPFASTLFMPNVSKSFKKNAADYFKSCKSLVNEIRNGNLTIEDSKDIVDYYNSCK